MLLITASGLSVDKEALRGNVFNCVNIHKSGADKHSCAQAFSTNTKAAFQYEYKLSNTYL